MSNLVKFYLDEQPNPEGYRREEILSWGDDRWEMDHTFIQWLFPLREPSHFNPDAPLLTDSDVEAWRDPVLKDRLFESYRRFLEFIGLDYQDYDSVVVTLPSFMKKQAVYLEPNHNWFRISRVLASLTQLGLVAEARALYDFLAFLNKTNWSMSFDYWTKAVGDDTIQTGMVHGALEF